MRAAIIENGIVINIIEVGSLSDVQGAVYISGAGIGDEYDGINFTTPIKLPTVPEYVAAIQAVLDTKAHERNYDNILSACTYATSTVPKFKAEGQACVDWRDAMWSTAYSLLADVNAGTMEQPTLEALLAMLPSLTWPDEAPAEE